MNSTPKVSEAEWTVMEIIWEVKKVKASEVIERLADSSDWKPKTIKAMLNRLLLKEVIGYEKSGKEYIYYPVVSKDDCIKTENDSFLSRVHNGVLSQMLVSFLDSKSLSKNEIEELEKILHERKQK
jgi:BlaI family penicillinase repressor